MSLIESFCIAIAILITFIGVVTPFVSFAFMLAALAVPDPDPERKKIVICFFILFFISATLLIYCIGNQYFPTAFVEKMFHPATLEK